jgi:hypothetical protein
MGLSLAARCESLPHPPATNLIIARSLLLLPVLAMSCWWFPHHALVSALALVPFTIWIGWTMFRRPVPRLVSGLLAGIPLIDWIAAIPLGVSLTLPGMNPPPASWIALLLPPCAWALALILQRFSPAT